MTLLDITDLNDASLNAAYRRLMKIHHVDKGGELEINQSITRARRILKSCLDNNRLPPRNGTYTSGTFASGTSGAGSSSSRTQQSGTFEDFYHYANSNDDWGQYNKIFRPKQRNPKFYSKPTRFDRAFQQGWQHPEDADDPTDSNVGKARSRPRKYNNDYEYDSDDEFIPNDKQNFSTKDEGEPRV